MSTAVQFPAGISIELDDAQTPGTYVTDGEQLYRLMGAGEPRRGFVWIENCKTLEITVVHSSELRGWDMTPICPQAIALAA